MEHDTLMDLSELVLENKKKEKTELDLFREVLRNCHENIRQKNKIGYKHSIYDIPPLLWGKPKYDADAMRNYLVDHLTNNGFYVRVQSRRSIYICWDEKFLDLEKFYQHKKQIENEYDSMTLPTGFPVNIDRSTMEFRQHRQREIQMAREQRFAAKNNRYAHLN